MTVPTTERFKRALAYVLELEGLLSNHPDDPGGLTYMGITARDHPDLFANGRIPTRQECEARIWRDYWRPQYDHLTYEPLAHELLEAGLLCGKARAGLFVQAAFNLLRPDGWKCLEPDGVFGPISLAAVSRYCRMSDEAADGLYAAANGEEYEHFEKIVEGTTEDSIGMTVPQRTRLRKFVRGWCAKRLT